MKAIIKKGFDRGYFLDVIKHVNMITKIPNNVVFYIIHNKSDCISAINKLTAESKKEFINLCKKEVSFSYVHDNIHYIIIDLKNEDYLLYDRDALTGLILHELMHIKTPDYFDKRMISDLKKVIYINIKKSRVKKKDSNVIFDIMKHSMMLLKDLYVNERLMQMDLGNYLMRYYYQYFSKKRDLGALFKNKDIKNSRFIDDVLKIQLSLFTAIWPAEKFEIYNYDLFLKYIEDNSNIKIKKLDGMFSNLKKIYFKDYGSKKFNTMFFQEILNITGRRLR